MQICLKVTAATLAAFLVGLLIEVNFGGDWQKLDLRVLLPVLELLLEPVLLRLQILLLRLPDMLYHLR